MEMLNVCTQLSLKIVGKLSCLKFGKKASWTALNCLVEQKKAKKKCILCPYFQLTNHDALFAPHINSIYCQLLHSTRLKSIEIIHIHISIIKSLEFNFMYRFPFPIRVYRDQMLIRVQILNMVILLGH